MTPIQIGIEVSAYVGVALIFGAVIATTCAFIKAQTMLLKAAFTENKNPHAHLHPYTQSVLNGECIEIREAQRAIEHGDIDTARMLVDEICSLLDAEKDKSMRTQLQVKLKRAVTRRVREAPQGERRTLAVRKGSKQVVRVSQPILLK